jgi:hypothetical protein
MSYGVAEEYVVSNYTEDGGDMYLRNGGKYLQVYWALPLVTN